MLSLKIKEVLEYSQYLVESKTIKETISLGILGIDKLNVGDNLMIHEDLLDRSNKNYTMPLFFEITKEKSSKEIKEENDKEYGAVKTNGKTRTIKRIYG